jgi:hypothetical protein
MKRQLIYHTPIELNASTYKTNEASVLAGKGIYERATIKTISRDGICLNCDQETLSRLLPNTTSVSPKQPVKLELSFKLSNFLQVSANVICVRRLSKNTFQLEMRFDHLDTASESEIDAYVDNSLYKENRGAQTPVKSIADYCAVA